MTQQGKRHQSFNDLHAGSLTKINGDMIAGMLANEPGIAAKTINGITFEWLGLKGFSQTNLSGRMQAFAQNNGFDESSKWENLDQFTWDAWETEWGQDLTVVFNWSSMGDFNA